MNTPLIWNGQAAGRVCSDVVAFNVIVGTSNNDSVVEAVDSQPLDRRVAADEQAMIIEATLDVAKTIVDAAQLNQTRTARHKSRLSRAVDGDR